MIGADLEQAQPVLVAEQRLTGRGVPVDLGIADAR